MKEPTKVKSFERVKSPFFWVGVSILIFTIIIAVTFRWECVFGEHASLIVFIFLSSSIGINFYFSHLAIMHVAKRRRSEENVTQNVTRIFIARIVLLTSVLVLLGISITLYLL